MTQEHTTSAASRVPKPRTLRFSFEDVPRDWFGGNAIASHVANGVNLLFPAGERFFVRSVYRYLDRIDDPDLVARVRGFAGQEGRHAAAHEQYFDALRRQGYDVDTFLRFYERVAYGFIEKLAPPALRLSTTAACEHFTAILAEFALRRRVLDLAHPAMRDLLLWHAAEEIEHRSVAFDVLEKVAPGRVTRVAGLAMASACLGGFWIVGALALIAQEPNLPRREKLRLWREARARRGDGSVFRRGIREYLRNDFHPAQSPIDHLAEEYLARAGIA